MMMVLRSIAIAALVLLSTAPPRAQEQSSPPPVLRLETGMHTAPIRAVAADAGGQILATFSDEKTLRLWALPTGEPIGVLRPQIGNGAEGELKAVALSPDGRFVVTGGWTGFEWEKANSLYVFETGTGQLVRRIGGLPQVINRRAWSADGRFVAAGFARADGIKVVGSRGLAEGFRDSGYNRHVLGLGVDGVSL